MPTIVFLTVCTKDRRPWLATDETHDLLREVWIASAAWLVGRYVVMPDHVHLFARPGGMDVPTTGCGTGSRSSRSGIGILRTCGSRTTGTGRCGRGRVMRRSGVGVFELGAQAVGGPAGGLEVCGGVEPVAVELMAADTAARPEARPPDCAAS